MVKHGMCKTRIYHIWIRMKDRCNNPKTKDYQYYGAKGIKVCDEWSNNFLSFYNWSIENNYNDTLTIDRIDGSKGYSPDNCRWISIRAQQRNRIDNIPLTINGVTKIEVEWAEEYNIDPRIFRRRLKLGWDPIDALTIPIDSKEKVNWKQSQLTIDGETKLLSEWAKIYNINPNTLRSRVRLLGWDLKDALTIPVGTISNYPK